MDDIEILEDLLDNLPGDLIAFRRIFATIGHGATPGLMLSQGWYWLQRTSDPDRWLSQNFVEWENATGLTHKEQQSARNKLVAKNLIETSASELGGRLRLRLNLPEIIKAIERTQNKTSSRTEKRFSGKTESLTADSE